MARATREETVRRWIRLEFEPGQGPLLIDDRPPRARRFRARMVGIQLTDGLLVQVAAQGPALRTAALVDVVWYCDWIEGRNGARLASMPQEVQDLVAEWLPFDPEDDHPVYLRAFSIPVSAVRRCPKVSLAPSHYRQDGSCRCTDQERSG